MSGQSKIYGARLGFANFDDEILIPGSCVECDAISTAASEREHSCQGLKDVEKNSQNLSDRRVLYLGTNPSRFRTAGKVTHYPVIQILPRKKEELEITLADLPFATHIIFTSKHAVIHFFNYLKDHPIDLSDKKLIAIGKVTANYLRREGEEPYLVSKEETQEGLVKELRPLDWEGAYVFLPRSSLGRAVLLQFFIQREIRHQVVNLYDTRVQKLDPLPNLQDFDEIVFTSPSTVKAFMHIFSRVPEGKKVTPIGPITAEACTKFLGSPMILGSYTNLGHKL